MTLSEQISRDITEAMKARDAVKLSALRMVKAALMNGEVAKGRPLEESEMQQVLASLLKQRRDSIEQFTKGGRQDLVDKETAEVGILERYAPPAASAADLEQAVDAAIKETGAAGPKDMGRVMKAVMSALAGKSADGKAVNEMVRKKLGG
ncbi:MAG TPA: GatB/YqeY domain-containing protein [Vicinamibacterales bacterium]|nr:GatB/YqeY domain-containing protein [Vicinamibacterales bacterium]